MNIEVETIPESEQEPITFFNDCVAYFQNDKGIIVGAFRVNSRGNYKYQMFDIDKGYRHFGDNKTYPEMLEYLDLCNYRQIRNSKIVITIE